MDRVPLGPETNRVNTQSRVIEVREREREAWLWWVLWLSGTALTA